MGNSKSNRGLSPSPKFTVEAQYRSAIGVDVHRDLLVCCYQEHNPEKNEMLTEMANFGTKCSQLMEFAQWCANLSPDVIIMESTGVLWRSPYEALESVGFTNKQLALVNARDVKAAVGRKTDAEDAKRLATFARLGTIKRSFVPGKLFRDMRLLARLYKKTVDNFARTKNRYNKILNSAGFRASSVFSDTNGKAAKILLDAFVFGSKEDQAVALNCRAVKRLKASPEEIQDALNATCNPVILELLRKVKADIDSQRKLADEYMSMLRQAQAPYEHCIELLVRIPGIKETSARLIFAELCDNIGEYFPDAEHFASWMGICPGNNVSANKSYSGKSAKGNKWIRAALTECANGIALSRRGSLYKRFLGYKARRGHKRAIVALAHKLARIIYCCLKYGILYQEEDKFDLRACLSRHVAKIQLNVESAIRLAECSTIDRPITGLRRSVAMNS